MNTRLMLASIALLSSSAAALASNSATILMPNGSVKASIAATSAAAPGGKLDVSMSLANESKSAVNLWVAPLNLRYSSGGELRQIIADASVRTLKLDAGGSASLHWIVTLPADADRGSNYRIGTLVRDALGRGALLWATGLVDDGLRPEIPERRMRGDQKPMPKPTFEGDIRAESKPEKSAVKKP